MKKITFFLTLIISLQQTHFSYCQFPQEINGEFKECIVYKFNFKDSIVDTTSFYKAELIKYN